MSFRIGQGIDVHAFGGEGPVVIGGVTIEHERGIVGHSDADVATHAVMDALLGAVGEGDIGQHFPDDDETYAGANSLILASHVADLVAERGFEICNVDVTVIAQTPRISPYRGAMAANLSQALRISELSVNVKATTTEELGFLGQGEGIAAMAVALVAATS